MSRYKQYGLQTQCCMLHPKPFGSDSLETAYRGGSRASYGRLFLGARLTARKPLRLHPSKEPAGKGSDDALMLTPSANSVIMRQCEARDSHKTSLPNEV